MLGALGLVARQSGVSPSAPANPYLVAWIPIIIPVLGLILSSMHLALVRRTWRAHQFYTRCVHVCESALGIQLDRALGDFFATGTAYILPVDPKHSVKTEGKRMVNILPWRPRKTLEADETKRPRPTFWLLGDVSL